MRRSGPATPSVQRALKPPAPASQRPDSAASASAAAAAGRLAETTNRNRNLAPVYGHTVSTGSYRSSVVRVLGWVRLS